MRTRIQAILFMCKGHDILFSHRSWPWNTILVSTLKFRQVGIVRKENKKMHVDFPAILKNITDSNVYQSTYAYIRLAHGQLIFVFHIYVYWPSWQVRPPPFVKRTKTAGFRFFAKLNTKYTASQICEDRNNEKKKLVHVRTGYFWQRLNLIKKVNQNPR